MTAVLDRIRAEAHRIKREEPRRWAAAVAFAARHVADYLRSDAAILREHEPSMTGVADLLELRSGMWRRKAERCDRLSRGEPPFQPSARTA